jgi:hypothetical protein
MILVKAINVGSDHGGTAQMLQKLRPHDIGQPIQCKAEDAQPAVKKKCSSPRGQIRPDPVSAHRPVYPLERAIQKTPHVLQPRTQFRRHILIEIIRDPQRLRH